MPIPKVSKTVIDQLLNLTEDKEISEGQMQLLLQKVFKKEKEMMASFVSDFLDIEHNYKAEIKILNEQIKSLRDQLFGKKTEKIHKADGQLFLFDTFEPDTPILDEPEEIRVPAHNRKKPGRKPLPDNLPRFEVIHDLTEEEKTCGCGCMKSRCGKEESEQLEIIPAQMRVIKNIRYKYACKNCEGVEDDGPTVSIARMPEQMIPKSIATPELLAHILTAKFADALPFYRQEKQFHRIGVDIHRSNVCNLTMRVPQACEILLEYMKGEILNGPVINKVVFSIFYYGRFIRTGKT